MLLFLSQRIIILECLLFILTSSFKIVTEDKEFSADVVSAYKAAGNSDAYQPVIDDEDSYSNYLNIIKNKSNYQTEADVTCEQNTVTLYTCSLEGIT